MLVRTGQQKLSITAGRDVNDTVTLEDGLVVSYKAKHRLTIQSSNILLGIYPKELKTYIATKTCL